MPYASGMEFFDLKNIAEQTMEIVNPTTPEKLLRVGRIAGLQPGARVIDFGCGFGETLALWAQHYGVSGVGVDIRPDACDRATRKMAGLGLGERVQIVCGDAAAYPFEPGAFDVAACIGATFIWPGGYQAALAAMKPAVRPTGRLVTGEAFWRKPLVPPDLSRDQADWMTELELLRAMRAEGFDLTYVTHAGDDDWDRYESDNWQGLLRWLDTHPDHPGRRQVIDSLRASQQEYFSVGREYFGWALHVLAPAAVGP